MNIGQSNKGILNNTLMWIAFVIALPFLLLFKLYWTYEQRLGEQSLADTNIALVVLVEDDPAITEALVRHCLLSETATAKDKTGVQSVYRVVGTSRQISPSLSVPKFISKTVTEDLISMSPGKTKVDYRAIYAIFATPDPAGQARQWLNEQGYSDPNFKLESIGNNVSNYLHQKADSKIAKTIYSQAGTRVFRIEGYASDISEEGAGVAVSSVEHDILDNYLKLAGKQSSSTWSGSVLGFIMAVVATGIAAAVIVPSHWKLPKLMLLLPYALLWWEGSWTTFWTTIVICLCCVWMASSDSTRGPHRTPTYVIFLRCVFLVWLFVFAVFYLFGNTAAGRSYFSFIDTIIVSHFVTVAITLFFWAVLWLGTLLVSSDPEYQKWRQAGGHYFWDTLPRILNPDSDLIRRGGFSEPTYTSFVPPADWRFQCPKCGSRVKRAVDVCRNCN